MTGTIKQQAMLYPQNMLSYVGNQRYIILTPKRGETAAAIQYGVMIVAASSHLCYILLNGPSHTAVTALVGGALSCTNVGNKLVIDTTYQYSHNMVIVGGTIPDCYSVSYSNTAPTS